MVVLHGGGGVELGQARAALDLERVVGAAVVKVVAEARNQKGQALHLEENNDDIYQFSSFQFGPLCRRWSFEIVSTNLDFLFQIK